MLRYITRNNGNNKTVHKTLGRFFNFSKFNLLCITVGATHISIFPRLASEQLQGVEGFLTMTLRKLTNISILTLMSWATRIMKLLSPFCPGDSRYWG